GLVTISAREGMVKTYDLLTRHFGWEKLPRPATDRQITAYLLDRALRSQGVVSLDSICHLAASRKPAVRELIESRVRRKLLVPVTIAGAEKVPHWVAPESLERQHAQADRIHILSPFDPLIIQRKRLKLLFDYEHLFEAYVPAEKRRLGYFALPVLVGDRVVAAIDLKADRRERRLIVQNWTWIADCGTEAKAAINEAMHAFERFQCTPHAQD
ncbi:MAG TPA: crosslink repair DNA glycosylase YcaQ family protein, partial [Devosia sp.]|nr:crosslink repair DNA glycosylase YcaQ family protein [Devosia sp.]